jgi:hypothetical protein
MSAEGPIVSAAINRLPDKVLMLAAYGIVFSLSVTIESPIMNLLATATTLAKDRQSYLLIRKFTLHLLILLTAITFLVGYTGAFDVVVVNWMGVPLQVAGWVRPGMRIMLLWSAAIGWRRFIQGVLIRFNQTRKVGWGTIVRLVASGGSAIGLAVWGRWPGIVVGTVALMAGVITEAIYATIVVQPVLKNELRPAASPTTGKSLTYGDLLWFHLPLAGTSLLLLIAQPMVAFSLARLDNPTQSLAAWPLVYQVTLIARSAANALPEVVVALTQGPETLKPVRQFTLTLVAASTGLMALFLYTPLISLYLFDVQDTTAGVGEAARYGLYFFLLLPALSILISWLRGLLINTHATRIVTAGMALNLLLTATILFVGVQSRFPGILTAAVALNSSAFLELVILWWGVQHSLVEISQRPLEKFTLVRA